MSAYATRARVGVRDGSKRLSRRLSNIYDHINNLITTILYDDFCMAILMGEIVH
jgi:hypothetical protein